MKLFQTFLCSFVLIGLTRAQPVLAGLKIGVPFTDAFQNQPYPTVASLTASSNSYTLGPFVEVRLPLHLSIEADALYRGLHFTNLTGSASTGVWDFPIVAKYKFLKGPVRPYIEGGLDFSHLSDVKNFVVANNSSNFGVALGAGVEVHALVVRISPEVRYTGDALKSFSGIVNSNRNQLAFLIGIGF
jgi:outer membrane protein with beta-barrel domain